MSVPVVTAASRSSCGVTQNALAVAMTSCSSSRFRCIGSDGLRTRLSSCMFSPVQMLARRYQTLELRGCESRWAPTLEAFAHFKRIAWLVQHAVHATRPPSSLVCGQVSRRVGHDRDGSFTPSPSLALSDSRSRRQAIHDRHLHIHQDDVEILLAREQDCLQAVARYLRHDLPSRQQCTCQQLLNGAVIDQQQAQTRRAHKGGRILHQERHG